jgi:tRNA(fMet)-specific endonuclease VapC
VVILDTSIIIDHIRQTRFGKKTFLDEVVKTEGYYNLGLSVVSVQELYGGRSTRIKEQEDVLLDVLCNFKILPLTFELAVFAGKIVRDSVVSVSFADALIAATAVYNGFSLFTLNKKDFLNIPNVSLYYMNLWGW